MESNKEERNELNTQVETSYRKDDDNIKQMTILSPRKWVRNTGTYSSPIYQYVDNKKKRIRSKEIQKQNELS